MKILNPILLALIIILPVNSIAETLISKSATVNVADDKTHQIPPWGNFYIPAGTKIFNLNISRVHNGESKDLFITDSGLHVYYKRWKYWKGKNINAFKRSGAIVFIKRYYEAKIPFGQEGAVVTIPFTRGETYKLIEENDESFKINITEQDKLKGFSTELQMSVSIPRQYANLNNFEQELTKETIGYFESISNKGTLGIQKACGIESIETYPANIGKNNIGNYFNSVGVTGNKEIAEINGLGKGFSVRREYFRRNGEDGIYKITRLMSCNNSRNTSFHISTPYVSDIKIDSNWISKSENNINKDESTGKALITCPKDYFNLEDEFSNDFHNRDIPFLIYKTAKWKKFKNDCN